MGERERRRRSAGRVGEALIYGRAVNDQRVGETELGKSLYQHLGLGLPFVFGPLYSLIQSKPFTINP